MWLDRFPGHPMPSQSPPATQKRPYSPAPRRPSGLGPSGALRPPYGPRTSSLHLNARANISTTSVNSQRPPNGSTLKSQVSPPADFEDPLKALATIVGRSISEESIIDGDAGGNQLPEKPLELVEEVDFEGSSLEEFVHDHACVLERKSTKTDSTVQTVDQCKYVRPFRQPSIQFDKSAGEKEKDRFDDLHRSILVGCSSVEVGFRASSLRIIRHATTF